MADAGLGLGEFVRAAVSLLRNVSRALLPNRPGIYGLVLFGSGHVALWALGRMEGAAGARVGADRGAARQPDIGPWRKWLCAAVVAKGFSVSERRSLSGEVRGAGCVCPAVAGGVCVWAR